MLQQSPAGLLRGPVGVVAHAASRTLDGRWTPEALAEQVPIASLMGPEHGIHSSAGAGEDVAHSHHPDLNCPVWSLYGETRSPEEEMLNGADWVLFDLQDLGVRCYTYGATLRRVMERCEQFGRPLVVADRPCPFMDCVDGPMLQPAFTSFVAELNLPLVYGMSTGETALWLKDTEFPTIELIVLFAGERIRHRPESAVWHPPSPAIVSQASAQCYPATVWVEALPELDAGRRGPFPFQHIAAPWLQADAVSERFNRDAGDGYIAEPAVIRALGPPYDGQKLPAVRLHQVPGTDVRPVRAGLRLLESVQNLRGCEALWSADTARPDWMDKLMGTDAVRLCLQHQEDLPALFLDWERDSQSFLSERERALDPERRMHAHPLNAQGGRR